MEPETIAQVLALIEQRPADAELYQQLAHLYSKTGQRLEARKALERALERDPKDAFTHLYLGNWFHVAAMYPEALARFKHAAELLPNEAVAYWCQGDAYRSQGQYRLAHEAYEAAVRVDPDDEQARDKLAAWNKCRTGTTERTPGMEA